VSRESLLRDERKWIALALALNSDYLDEALLKIAFARNFYLSAAPGATIGLDAVVDILEDESLGLSDEAAVSALESSGLLARDGDALLMPDVVTPTDPIQSEIAAPLEISRDEIGRLLSEADSVMAAPADALIASLDRTTRWGMNIAALVPEDLDGVPCFWDYDDRGYSPFNLDPASVTTSDALRLIVERVRVGGQLPSAGVEEREAACALWARLLRLSRSDSEWNKGSFSVAGEDDDFVGAFDPARPELGPCPTVDATGGAVIALCAALGTDLADQGGAGELVDPSRDAVREEVDFLLRCQLPSGGWPIYRYQDDAHPMVERDVSTWYAVEALAEARMAGLLDPDVGERSRLALGAMLDLAERSAVRSGATVAWAPDFFTPYPNDRQQIQATATISLALGAVARGWPEFQDRIADLRRGASLLVADRWSPDPDALAVVDFRVPTWDGPAATRFPWEWPLDALAVQMLADIEEPWSEALSLKLARAVSGFLSTEINGHWNDLLMKRESGKDRAVVGSTIFFHSAILAYVRRQASLTAEFFAPASISDHQTNPRP
jgi:hypothetical protein